MNKETIKKVLLDEEGFLELTENMTANQWHDTVLFYLNKIKNHEVRLKHTVRLFGMKNTDFSTGEETYKKVWICEDCNKIFLKVKLNPKILEIKEFYQMCYDGGFSDLVRGHGFRSLLGGDGSALEPGLAGVLASFEGVDGRAHETCRCKAGS